MLEAEFIIKKLKLIPHPEGGYFRETYRSDELIDSEHLPIRYKSKRNFSTSIYYMLVGEQISYFHKLQSEEIWHFYKGSTIIIHCLDKNIGYSKIRIGNDFEKDIFPQYTVNKETWFAAEVEDKSSYAFVGCTVSPGFDFSDFELGNQHELLKMFPGHKQLIKKFTLPRNNI